MLAVFLAGGCRPGAHPPDAPPSAVADWLIDKLYVEVRQAQAIEAAVDAARARIASEQAAVEGVRGGQAAIASRQSKVYWERVASPTAAAPGARTRTFVYRLSFRASGGAPGGAGGAASGMRIEKEVSLETVEVDPGVHRVRSILERDLSPGVTTAR